MLLVRQLEKLLYITVLYQTCAVSYQGWPGRHYITMADGNYFWAEDDDIIKFVEELSETLVTCGHGWPYCMLCVYRCYLIATILLNAG